MDRSTQAALSAVIFGFICALMTVAASVAVYACTQPNAAPALVSVAGFFTLFAIGSGVTAYVAARSN